MSEDKYEDFNKVLKRYYIIKNQYAKSIIKKKEKIMKAKISKKEKIARIKQIKNKCINCKRDVDMVFLERNRKMMVKCGDIENPCKLNIDLDKGVLVSVDKEIQRIKQLVDNNISEIIRTKLDLLFNYIDEEKAVNDFDIKKKNFNENSKLLNTYRNLYNDIKDDEKKNDEVKKNMIELNAIKDEINILKKNFQSDGRNENIVAIIELYKNRFLPLIESVRKNKFTYQNVFYKKSDNKYLIEQEKYTEKDIQIYIEEPKILSNNK